VALRDALLVHQRAILPAVGARGVQAQQWRARACLFDIDAMLAPEQFEMQVAANDWLELRAHDRAPSARSVRQRLLEVAQIGHETCRSPSAFSTPRLISAIRSLEPGGGRWLQSFRHSSSGARSAKDDDGITNGPRATDMTLPSKIWISQAVGPTLQQERGGEKAAAPDQRRVAVNPRLERLDHVWPPCPS